MRVFAISMFATLLLGCVASPAPKSEFGTEVWTSMIHFDDVRNFSVLQTNGTSALMLTFFPNYGASNPTVCRQSGTILSRDAQGMRLSTVVGTCENGRGIAAATFTCESIEPGTMNCHRAGKRPWKFTLEKRGLYEPESGR